jgi:diaminopimelate epimerase
MKLNFFKYEGAGNDFILIDNRNGAFSPINRTETIKKMCDRHFGIGADGLMILELKDNFDFEMRYFNADGREGSMCGNGGRCIVAFAKHLKLIQAETNFLAVDGPHYATISENGNWVSLQMIDVQEIKPDGKAFVLNTGSPHYVLEVKDLASKEVNQDGKNIRYNDEYSEVGINVNRVEISAEDSLIMRTYERGVEDETYSCGTGVTAAVLSYAINKNMEIGEVFVSTRGGNLSVNFEHKKSGFVNIWLNGPAEFVFNGLY